VIPPRDAREGKQGTTSQELKELDRELSFGFTDRHEERFPRLLSQLFNGGQMPWGYLPVFSKPDRIDIDIDDIEEESMTRFLELLDRGNFKLAVRSQDFNDLTEQHLRRLDRHKIVSLLLDYDAYFMYAEKVEDFYDMPREQAMRKAGFQIELDLELSHLEELTIKLHDYFSVEDQLEPFLDLHPDTKVIVFSDDGEEAAKYVLETHDRWPDSSVFYFRGINNRLLEKLERRFPESREEDLFGDEDED